MNTMGPEYNTGIAVLDEQHQQLFRLTNQAQTLLKDQNMLYKFDELKEILDGIRSYTLSHFVEEETFMKNAAYDKLDEHLALHQKFLDNLTRIDEEASRVSLGTQDSILRELLDYLTEWLQRHILMIDKGMVKEIEAAG